MTCTIPRIKLIEKKMKYQLSDIERRISAVLQDGFPKSENPYKGMAEQAGIDTKQLLAVLENRKREVKQRRTGAITDRFKAGLSVIAKVVRQAAEEGFEQVGEKLVGFREVSYAYERNTVENRPYNRYRMSQAYGVPHYRIPLTEKELKKVPPTYITESGTDTKEEEQECLNCPFLKI